MTTASEGRYDLALFPWENAAQVVAEAEAIIAEQNSKPWLGLELTDEEIQFLLGPAECRCFKFDGDFCGVTGRLDQEPGYNEGTQPWLF